MSTTVHKLEAEQNELELALDQRHEIRLPDWEIEIDALGERPPEPPPLEWGGLMFMAAGFDGGGGEPPPEEDWELEQLTDPEPDGPELEYEQIEWITDPDDWDVEELEAVGEHPAIPEPSAWSGALMAMGFGDGGGGGGEPTPSDDDEDWELDNLAGELDEQAEDD